MTRTPIYTFVQTGKNYLYCPTTSEGYREYKSDPKKCTECPLVKEYTREKNKKKVLTRHVWEEYKEKVRLNRLIKSGKMLFKFRKEKIERSFADSKELHGLTVVGCVD